MSSFFGIVLDKNNGNGSRSWKMSATGTLTVLRQLEVHDDTVRREEMKDAVEADERDAVTLENTRTGKAESGRIYRFRT